MNTGGPYRTPARVNCWRAFDRLIETDPVKVTNPGFGAESYRDREGWVSIAKQGVYLVNLRPLGAPEWERTTSTAVFYRHELTKL